MIRPRWLQILHFARCTHIIYSQSGNFYFPTWKVNIDRVLPYSPFLIGIYNFLFYFSFMHSNYHDHCCCRWHSHGCDHLIETVVTTTIPIASTSTINTLTCSLSFAAAPTIAIFDIAIFDISLADSLTLLSLLCHHHCYHFHHSRTATIAIVAPLLPPLQFFDWTNSIQNVLGMVMQWVYVACFCLQRLCQFFFLLPLPTSFPLLITIFL